MQWELERWIKFYVRETPDSHDWPWQAHAVWPQIMKRLDPLGELHLGSKGIALLARMMRWPVGVVAAGISALIAHGTVTLAGGVLSAPNFVKAQQTRTADRLRKERQREFGRLLSKQAESLASMSQQVTAGHTESQQVTRSHDKREEREEREEILRSELGLAESGEGRPSPRRKKPEPSPEAEACAKHLLEAIRSHEPDHKDKHLRGWARDLDLAIREDGRTPDQLRKAADYAHRTGRPFNRSLILSGAALRKWFEKLRIEAKEQRDAGASRQSRGLTGDDLMAAAAQMRADEEKRSNGHE